MVYVGLMFFSLSYIVFELRLGSLFFIKMIGRNFHQDCFLLNLKDVCFSA